MPASGEIQIRTFNREITAAGTPERLNEAYNKEYAHVICVEIKASRTNAGVMYIGRLPGTAAAGYARYLVPGETIIFDVHDFFDAYIDLQNIWFDGTVNGDDLEITCFEVP